MYTGSLSSLTRNSRSVASVCPCNVVGYYWVFCALTELHSPHEHQPAHSSGQQTAFTPSDYFHMVFWTPLLSLKVCSQVVKGRHYILLCTAFHGWASHLCTSGEEALLDIPRGCLWDAVCHHYVQSIEVSRALCISWVLMNAFPATS